MILNPSQLLIHILTPFSTRALLPLTAVSHRFHGLIVRILHSRLLLAAALKDHNLILECYHPASKYSEPYLGCQYLGTDGLSDSREGEGSFYSGMQTAYQLGELRELYSRFRPFRMDVDEKRRRHPAGDVPGRSEARTSNPSRDSQSTTPEDCVSHIITLEAHELFSQMCGCVNLVKVGPRRGLFAACVCVAEGVMRIWRRWLAERARQLALQASSELVPGVLETQHGISASTTNGYVGIMGDERMVWIDSGKNVGIRVKVKERSSGRDLPLLISRDEDVAVSYAVEFEGKGAQIS